MAWSLTQHLVGVAQCAGHTHRNTEGLGVLVCAARM